MKYDFPKPVELISDGELDKLNQLLPWACFTVDSSGRKLGRAFSDHKRNDPQDILDFRIVELNQRFALAGRSVLEMGCFEGVHTAALCQFGADVTAVDGRSEHVVKTQIRCGFYGHQPRIYCLDLEDHSMIKLPEFDVMVHIGVLYHLTDPVHHLNTVLPRIRYAVLLDTHIARLEEVSESYVACGKLYPFRLYEEGGRGEPFSGMRDHAKWLLREDLLDILGKFGFHNIDYLAVENQRNGLRIRVLAQR